MSTPADEMKRRTKNVAATLAKPPSGNVPVGTPAVSPVGASINEQLRSARAQVSPLGRDINKALATGAPAAPAVAPPPTAASGLPSYRTPDGFRQTPTPVNPDPRAALARPAVTGPSGAAARAPGAASRPLRPGKLGTAGLVWEGLNIAGAAQDGGLPAAAGETAAAGTRLGAAKLGAEVFGKLPGRLKAPGAALGAIAGYAGGQKLVEFARENTPESVKTALSASNQLEPITRNVGSLPAAGGQLSSLVSNITSGRLRSAFGGDQQQPATAAPGRLVSRAGALTSPATRLAAPVAAEMPAAAAPAQKVIGNFQAQGRPERQVFEDGSISPTTANVEGGLSVIPAYQGAPTVANRLAAPTVGGAGFADGDRRQFERQIDTQIKDLGDLNMASKRRLVADLLGLKGRSVGQGFDAATGRSTVQAQLSQQADIAQMGADVDREQISASERSSRRAQRSQQQTITDADGTVYAVDGKTLTPLTRPDGKQLQAPRTSKTQDNQQAEIAAKLLEGMVMPGATPDEINAAVTQANSAAAALMGGGAGAQPSGAPKSGDVVGGYRFKGGDPNKQENWTKAE